MRNNKTLPFRLRPMVKRDIPEGMRLKQAAKWNQLEEDWVLFLEAGPDSCFVAEINGKVIGTVTIINYDRRFSWIGMVLVDPGTRRMGIGTALLKEAIRVASSKGTIRLDATPEGKKLYDTLGFRDEYNLCRYQLTATQKEIQPAVLLSCQEMSVEDIDMIIDYDQEIFGAPRPAILGSLFRMGKEYAWIAKSGNRVIGYCLGRPGSNFEQVGPIIARDTKTACSLLLHALHQCQGKSVVVDVLNRQKDFRLFIEDKIGFITQRSFIRMYLGTHEYRGKPEFQYCIAGPEIG